MFDSCLSEFGCRRRQGKIQRPVNALCSFLRRNWAATGYKAQYRRRQKETRQRSKDYQRYIDAWFTKLAKLIVLRIDLSYQPEHWGTISLDDLNADYERLAGR